MTVADNLEQVFGADPTVSFTLVSDANAMLFTPMLAEVAGRQLGAVAHQRPLADQSAPDFGSAWPSRETRCGAPLRAPRSRRPELRTRANSRQTRSSTTSWCWHSAQSATTWGLRAYEDTAFDFKTLLDAIRIRNHVIDLFERAEREADRIRRRQMLTFVSRRRRLRRRRDRRSALNDFARGILVDFPRIELDDLQIVLVHSRDRILPELSETLGRYALRPAARARRDV